MSSGPHGEQSIEANGLRFRVAIDGPEVAPWIVFSNSLATDLSLWDPQVEALGNSWRILRYDYRGHGGTESTDGAATGRETLAADLLAVMDSIGVERAHHVGTSMGALAGVAAATAQPQRFESVVVCNSRLRSSDGSAAHLERRAALAADQGMDSLVDITLEKWFAHSEPPVSGALRERIVNMIRSTSPQGYAGYARGIQRYDFSAEIGALPVPVLLIAGTMDGDVLQEFQAITNRHPRIRCEPMGGAGHLPNVEAPERFNAILGDFIAQSRRPS